MTEEQNKLADRLQAMLDQVGHPDYSLRELYEGLKLIVWELREREPATDAVLEAPVTVGFGVKIRSDGEIGRLTVEQYENRVVLTKEQALSLAAQIQEKVKP